MFEKIEVEVTKESEIGKIFYLFYLIALGFGAAFFNVYAYFTLWTWFAVSIGLTALSYGQVGGFLLIIAGLKYKYDGKERSPKQHHERIWMSIFTNLFVLGFGYVFKLMV